MPEPLSDKSMTREERIKLARARAAEGLPEVLDQARKPRVGTIPSIGPVKSPVEWAKARRACREYVIGAVRSGRLVNYDELQVLTYEASQMKLGFRMIPRMCEEIKKTPMGACCLRGSLTGRRDVRVKASSTSPAVRVSTFRWRLCSDRRKSISTRWSTVDTQLF